MLHAITSSQSHLKNRSEMTRVTMAMMETEIYSEAIHLSGQGWPSVFL